MIITASVPVVEGFEQARRAALAAVMAQVREEVEFSIERYGDALLLVARLGAETPS